VSFRVSVLGVIVWSKQWCISCDSAVRHPSNCVLVQTRNISRKLSNQIRLRL